jgi:hypothetical protein
MGQPVKRMLKIECEYAHWKILMFSVGNDVPHRDHGVEYGIARNSTVLRRF